MDFSAVINKLPEAVESFLICDNNEDSKKLRAEIIIEMLLPSLEGKKFLDFGCGEGHVAKVASLKASISIGYDISVNEVNNQFILTNSIDIVKQHAPYDVILIYDVIDHAIDNHQEIMPLIASLSSNTTDIRLRTHPWTSRHATHLYKQINKAYMHLIFTDTELREMGYNQTPTIPIIQPINAYKDLIGKAGLNIISHNIIREPVESIFQDEEFISNRIKAHWKNCPNPELSSGRAFPIFQLEQQFHDFILRKA